MAKHDIVVLNTTSSGFETDLGNNIARIKGTADDLFSVRNSSEVNKFAVSSVDDSMIIDGDLTLTGNLSSSLNSTASFGKIVATKFVGDATQMTNTNQTSHVSSSKQLEARISGAFTAGFTTTGDISGSVTSTGSFTKVVANTYVGSGAQLFDPPATPGQLSGSAQIASNISGSFTSGFVLQSKTVSISGSGTSTGSFGTLVTGTTVGLQSTISDTSGFTGLPSFAGFISSSAQIAADISGSFTSGFGYAGTISGSATSTGSFGRVDNIDSITGDASQVTGLPIPTNSVSGSAQLASNISGSFNKGFEFDNSISGSATSTGSFSRLNFNSFSVTDASGITGHEAGHASASSVIAAGISASFQGGFDFNGTISGSSPSELRVHNLNLGGTFTFGSTNLIKNWDSSYVRTATFGNSLGTAISGAFQSGFGFKGTISGSATSTGSFSKIKSQKLFVKEMVGKRKPISGSMNHDNYVTASYKTDSHGRITIPTFGRGHTMNTQQFTATGSMEDQKYRARAGQLFIDNFGRLNMTVQTGSLVEVPGAWTEGPTPPTKLGGTYQAAGTRDAFIIGGGNNSTSSMVFDGISYSDTKSLTAKHGNSTGTVNLGAGTVDSAAFIFDTAGGNGVGAPGFSNIPAHTDWHEEWDGVSWSRCTVAIPDSGRNKGAAKGSANAHLIWGGTDSPGHHTMCWNGATWQSVAPTMTTTRGYTSGFGPSDSAVAAGGAGNTSGTCTEEWNGVSWSTGNALPEIHQSGGGMGNSQNAGLVMGNTFPTYHEAKRAHSYNGTSWSEEVDLPIQHQRPATGGTAARGFGAVSSGDPWGKTTFWTGGFITGSVETYNKFSQNSDGRYLLTKKLQANYSPGTSGGGSTSNGEDFGGGY